MKGFLTNSKEYEIQTNGQLTQILNRFDANYLLDIIEDTLERQLNTFDLTGPPNAVLSFEDMFKQLYETYPNETDNIDDTRIEVYYNIIRIICKKMGLQFEEQQGLDIYTMAYYLYDFFVSRLSNYIVTFYDKFLDEQRDQIYSDLNLENYAKSKDISTSYSKLVFDEGTVISVIIAHLPYVLNSLKDMPVEDWYIYNIIYGEQNQNIVSLFTDNIIPNSSIFNLFNRILFNQYLYPTVVTHIRMALQMSHAKEIQEVLQQNQGK